MTSTKETHGVWQNPAFDALSNNQLPKGVTNVHPWVICMCERFLCMCVFMSCWRANAKFCLWLIKTCVVKITFELSNKGGLKCHVAHQLPTRPSLGVPGKFWLNTSKVFFRSFSTVVTQSGTHTHTRYNCLCFTAIIMLLFKLILLITSLPFGERCWAFTM